MLTVQDDLESLFYELLFIALGGRLPWQRLDVETMSLSKHALLTPVLFPHKVLAKCPEKFRPVVRDYHQLLLKDAIITPGEIVELLSKYARD